jgi:signal transduction histidine kinase
MKALGGLLYIFVTTLPGNAGVAPPLRNILVAGLQPGFWRMYWPYLVTFAVVLLLHKALILHLLLERRKRRKSEDALREMTKRVIERSEEERRHIARELHDDFSQRLSLISYQIESISAVRPSGMVKGLNLAEPLDELQSLITDIHGLSHRLHSSKLEHLGLKVAMKELCRQLSAKYDVSIDLNTSGLSTTPPHDIALCLYRVAQEALDNVIKHSGAGSAEVILTEANGRIELEITDSGRGFDPAIAGSGLGLTAMAERIRMMRGRLKIQSAAGAGTTVSATIELPRVSEFISYDTPGGVTGSSEVQP